MACLGYLQFLLLSAAGHGALVVFVAIIVFIIISVGFVFNIVVINVCVVAFVVVVVVIKFVVVIFPPYCKFSALLLPTLC